MQRLRLTFVFLAAAGLSACGGGSESGSAGGGGAVAAPTSTGTVLLMDGGDRRTAPAAVMGFVHGLNAVVVDGGRVYAGMTAIDATSGANGAMTLGLGQDFSAQIVPNGAGYDLRFSSGETIALKEGAAK